VPEVGADPQPARELDVRKQAQISPPPFFLRLSPVGGSGWKPSKSKRFRGGGRSPASKGVGRAKAGTHFPTALFFAAVACRRQRLEAIPPSGSKIHRCRRRSADRDRGQQQRRQNPPPPQAFGWSGSRAAKRQQGSAGRDRGQQNGSRVRLVGFEGGNVKERKRKNPIFAAGEIMPWPSVAHIDPSHRPQIKGAGGGRRRRKKRRAAADKTAL